MDEWIELEKTFYEGTSDSFETWQGEVNGPRAVFTRLTESRGELPGTMTIRAYVARDGPGSWWVTCKADLYERFREQQAGDCEALVNSVKLIR